jgi:hypothetical protein
MMNMAACGHVAVISWKRVCAHMLVEESPDFYRVLTGVGMRFDLACGDCLTGPFLEVCEGCADHAEEWSETLGWKGTPEVLHDDRPMGPVSARPCDVEPLNDRCFALVEGGWLAVTARELIGSDGSRWAVPLTLTGLTPVRHRQVVPALHASADGRYAAVVHDHGHTGVVLDTRSGEVVLELDRGTYRVEETPFPLAFLSGDRVVAATDWNRLDVFDLMTGRSLTEGQPGNTPQFHGGLAVSPCGRMLLDDCWVWGPAGMPRVIDLETWLRDGGDPPGLRLAQRWYAWNQPVAWVTSNIVAVQRIGDDDELMVDGVELFDVTSGRRYEPFAGPVGRMWGHRGLLYVSAADGFEVWDPQRGARIGFIAGFRPIAHRDGTFVSLDDGMLSSFSVS